MNKDSQASPGSELDHEENKLIAQRREKLALIRDQRQAFPNTFKRQDLAADLLASYDSLAAEELAKQAVQTKH